MAKKVERREKPDAEEIIVEYPEVTSHEIIGLADILGIRASKQFSAAVRSLVFSGMFHALREPSQAEVEIWEALADDPLSETTLKLLAANTREGSFVRDCLDRKRTELAKHGCLGTLEEAIAFQSLARNAVNLLRPKRRGAPVTTTARKVFFFDVLRVAFGFGSDQHLPQKLKDRSGPDENFPLFMFGRAVFAIVEDRIKQAGFTDRFLLPERPPPQKTAYGRASPKEWKEKKQLKRREQILLAMLNAREDYLERVRPITPYAANSTN